MKKKYTPIVYIKFILFSLLGVALFFLPVSIGGKSTIPIDHMVGYIGSAGAVVIPYIILTLIIVGAVFPFVNKSWNRSITDLIFTFLRLAGAVIAPLAMFGIGPQAIQSPNLLPFIWSKLVIPVGTLVPVGAAFLSLILSYGLLEFIGVIMEPVMRPIWKVPGRSAIDAVASFVGSYSIGLLITNQVYKRGQYSGREAAIIATGFSTVSATFMIIVAKTVGFIDNWNFFFWTTLAITFLTTAITVRIRPLAKKADNYLVTDGIDAAPLQGSRPARAWQLGLDTAAAAPTFVRNMRLNFIGGLKMTITLLPTLLSVGLFGLLLAEFTPLFDYLGYLFYPVAWLCQLPEAFLTSKAAALEIAEMFLPALAVKEALPITRYVVGVVSISAILFFSALVPCIMATEIPVSFKEIIIIWIERTIISIVLASVVGHIFL